MIFITKHIPAFGFRRFLLVAANVVLCSIGGAQEVHTAREPVDFVDPRIGVLGTGAGEEVIGPTLPHGSIQPSPDTVDGGQGGYQSGKPIRGFSQLHASGTGWGRYGNLLLSPQVGLNVAPDGHDSPADQEKAEVSAYKVHLTRYNILTELTPTHHAAIYRFTFPASDRASLMLDLGQQVPGQLGTRPGDGYVDQSTLNLNRDGKSFSGSSRYSGGFGGGSYTVYFYGQIQTAPEACGTWKNLTVGEIHNAIWQQSGDRVGGWWRFHSDGKQQELLKIAVSFRSVERAKQYLDREIPQWNYDAVRNAARRAWNKSLHKIDVSGGNETQRTLFYTALYHAQIMPRDRTGEFERFAEHTPIWDDFYATWDIWRTKYPLLLMINPTAVRGAISTFEERLRVDGQVRDSFVSGYGGPGQRKAIMPFPGHVGNVEDNPDQGGNDIDNIIADAYVKGLKGVDWNRAYAVLRHNAEQERQGNALESAGDYRRQGWIRPGTMSVSNTLEYAYNDFCASEVATGLNRHQDARRYLARSRQWQHFFNPQAESEGYKGFDEPRNQDGTWIDVDLKKYPGSWKPYFYESNSWTYTYFAPHQISRLVELMGGPEIFAQRLDYANSHKLIDFFNEPGFLAPTLFHYAGRPDLSAKWMRRFVADGYTLQGYPGDDDSGAMAAYYIWASLGIFPNAGQDIYFLNGPLFDGVVVNRPEEGTLTVTRSGQGDYVASVTLNGKPLDRAWLRHRELTGNTVLHFTMSVTPTKWGAGILPPSDASLATPLP